MHILSGDIGGTNTRLALFRLDGERPRMLLEKHYPSNDYQTLTPILEQFLQQLDTPPEAAALALAGPIIDRRCQLTNLPWLVDAGQLEQRLGLSHISLLNDLEATAWGIGALEPDDLITLQAGSTRAAGNQAVIAAGTGLGEAGLFWDGSRHHPFPSEGGHCDFAPDDELTCALLHWLQRTTGSNHISWEQVVSGPGLVSIHRFLCQHEGISPPAWLQQRMTAGDAAAAISQAADSDEDALCQRSMALFSRLYGAETGNLALKQMATGGVFIGGGIAPKILTWLQRPEFLHAFLNKGPMRPLLQRMPLQVILNDKSALYGPAYFLQDRLKGHATN